MTLDVLETRGKSGRKKRLVILEQTRGNRIRYYRCPSCISSISSFRVILYQDLCGRKATSDKVIAKQAPRELGKSKADGEKVPKEV